MLTGSMARLRLRISQTCVNEQELHCLESSNLSLEQLRRPQSQQGGTTPAIV